MCTHVWVSITRVHVLSTDVHSCLGKHKACTEY